MIVRVYMQDSLDFLNSAIEWDEDCWRGDFDFWSGGELVIRTSEEQPILPTDKQKQAWVDFENNRRIIYQTLLDSVFVYYLKMRPRYVAAGEEWAKCMPEIRSAEKLKEMIRLHTIYISSDHKEEDVLIGLLFSCDWDSEHGLGVVVRSLEIDKVGGADCALLL